MDAGNWYPACLNKHLATAPSISISIAQLVCLGNAFCLRTSPLTCNRYLDVNVTSKKYLDFRKISNLVTVSITGINLTGITCINPKNCYLNCFNPYFPQAFFSNKFRLLA